MQGSELSRRSFLDKGLKTSTGLGLAGIGLTSTAKAESQFDPVALREGEKLRVAVFGCGNRSARHIAAVNYYADRMEVAALCDILPEKLSEKQAMVKSGKPRLYTDFEKMLAEGDDNSRCRASAECTTRDCRNAIPGTTRD